jgi:predicted TPR repeat methyltransferase
VKDAILRLHITSFIDKDNPRIFYYLGRCHFALANKDEALKYFSKAKELKPDMVEISFWLDNISLCKAGHVFAISGHVIAGYFEDLAPMFDETLSHRNIVAQDRFYERLAQIFLDQRAKDTNNIIAVDLGCGTGNGGKAFCQNFDHKIVLTGVDLSRAMLARARGKIDKMGIDIYTTCVNDNMLNYLASLEPESVDLVFCYDALGYQDNLTQIFASVAKILKSGAVFAFSLVCFNDMDTAKWLSGHRALAHSLEVIDYLMKQNSLTQIEKFAITDDEEKIYNKEKDKLFYNFYCQKNEG